MGGLIRFAAAQSVYSCEDEVFDVTPQVITLSTEGDTVQLKNCEYRKGLRIRYAASFIDSQYPHLPVTRKPIRMESCLVTGEYFSLDGIRMDGPEASMVIKDSQLTRIHGGGNWYNNGGGSNGAEITFENITGTSFTWDEFSLNSSATITVRSSTWSGGVPTQFLKGLLSGRGTAFIWEENAVLGASVNFNDVTMIGAARLTLRGNHFTGLIFQMNMLDAALLEVQHNTIEAVPINSHHVITYSMHLQKDQPKHAKGVDDGSSSLVQVQHKWIGNNISSSVKNSGCIVYSGGEKTFRANNIHLLFTDNTMSVTGHQSPALQIHGLTSTVRYEHSNRILSGAVVVTDGFKENSFVGITGSMLSYIQLGGGDAVQGEDGDSLTVDRLWDGVIVEVVGSRLISALNNQHSFLIELEGVNATNLSLSFQSVRMAGYLHILSDSLSDSLFFFNNLTIIARSGFATFTNRMLAKSNVLRFQDCDFSTGFIYSADETFNVSLFVEGGRMGSFQWVTKTESTLNARANEKLLFSAAGAEFNYVQLNFQMTHAKLSLINNRIAPLNVRTHAITVGSSNSEHIITMEDVEITMIENTITTSAEQNMFALLIHKGTKLGRGCFVHCSGNVFFGSVRIYFDGGSLYYDPSNRMLPQDTSKGQRLYEFRLGTPMNNSVVHLSSSVLSHLLIFPPSHAPQEQSIKNVTLLLTDVVVQADSSFSLNLVDDSEIFFNNATFLGSLAISSSVKGAATVTENVAKQLKVKMQGSTFADTLTVSFSNWMGDRSSLHLHGCRFLGRVAVGGAMKGGFGFCRIRGCQFDTLYWNAVVEGGGSSNSSSNKYGTSAIEVEFSENFMSAFNQGRGVSLRHVRWSFVDNNFTNTVPGQHAMLFSASNFAHTTHIFLRNVILCATSNSWGIYFYGGTGAGLGTLSETNQVYMESNTIEVGEVNTAIYVRFSDGRQRAAIVMGSSNRVLSGSVSIYFSNFTCVACHVALSNSSLRIFAVSSPPGQQPSDISFFNSTIMLQDSTVEETSILSLDRGSQYVSRNNHYHTDTVNFYAFVNHTEVAMAMRRRHEREGGEEEPSSSVPLLSPASPPMFLFQGDVFDVERLHIDMREEVFHTTSSTISSSSSSSSSTVQHAVKKRPGGALGRFSISETSISGILTLNIFGEQHTQSWEAEEEEGAEKEQEQETMMIMNGCIHSSTIGTLLLAATLPGAVVTSPENTPPTATTKTTTTLHSSGNGSLLRIQDSTVLENIQVSIIRLLGPNTTFSMRNTTIGKGTVTDRSKNFLALRIISLQLWGAVNTTNGPRPLANNIIATGGGGSVFELFNNTFASRNDKGVSIERVQFFPAPSSSTIAASAPTEEDDVSSSSISSFIHIADNVVDDLGGISVSAPTTVDTVATAPGVLVIERNVVSKGGSLRIVGPKIKTTGGGSGDQMASDWRWWSVIVQKNSFWDEEKEPTMKQRNSVTLLQIGPNSEIHLASPSLLLLPSTTALLYLSTVQISVDSLPSSSSWQPYSPQNVTIDLRGVATNTMLDLELPACPHSKLYLGAAASTTAINATAVVNGRVELTSYLRGTTQDTWEIFLQGGITGDHPSQVELLRRVVNMPPISPDDAPPQGKGGVEPTSQLYQRWHNVLMRLMMDTVNRTTCPTWEQWYFIAPHLSELAPPYSPDAGGSTSSMSLSLENFTSTQTASNAVSETSSSSSSLSGTVSDDSFTESANSTFSPSFSHLVPLSPAGNDEGTVILWTQESKSVVGAAASSVAVSAVAGGGGSAADAQSMMMVIGALGRCSSDSTLAGTGKASTETLSPWSVSGVPKRYQPLVGQLIILAAVWLIHFLIVGVVSLVKSTPFWRLAPLLRFPSFCFTAFFIALPGLLQSALYAGIEQKGERDNNVGDTGTNNQLSSTSSSSPSETAAVTVVNAAGVFIFIILAACSMGVWAVVYLKLSKMGFHFSEFAKDGILRNVPLAIRMGVLASGWWEKSTRLKLFSSLIRPLKAPLSRNHWVWFGNSTKMIVVAIVGCDLEISCGVRRWVLLLVNVVHVALVLWFRPYCFGIATISSTVVNGLTALAVVLSMGGKDHQVPGLLSATASIVLFFSCAQLIVTQISRRKLEPEERNLWQGLQRQQQQPLAQPLLVFTDLASEQSDQTATTGATKTSSSKAETDALGGGGEGSPNSTSNHKSGPLGCERRRTRRNSGGREEEEEEDLLELEEISSPSASLPATTV